MRHAVLGSMLAALAALPAAAFTPYRVADIDPVATGSGSPGRTASAPGTACRCRPLAPSSRSTAF
ncbi:MAG: hypothetical protein ABJC13_13380 [Acidobacteriota bacterium]